MDKVVLLGEGCIICIANAQCALRMNVHCTTSYWHITQLTDGQVLKDGGSALEAVTEAVSWTIIIHSDLKAT